LAKPKQFKKKTQPSIIDFLKELTTWVCSPEPSIEQLEKLLNRFPKINIGFIFKRLLSYNLNYPPFIQYCNEYFNNFYEFSSLSSNKLVHMENKVRLIQSIKYLMDSNYQSSKNKLFYLKSADLKDENRNQIKKVLSPYFNKVHNITYNDKELDFYCTLFERGFISEEELYDIDRLMNNGKKTMKLNLSTIGFTNFQDDIIKPSIMTAEQYLEHCKKREFSQEIASYRMQLAEHKQNRPECKACQLFGKPMVTLDTNMETFGQVDVMFVGLNPGTDEVTFDKTFIGRPSMKLREKIMKLHPDTTWVITNLIFCHTPNEKDLGEGWEKVATDCTKYFLNDVFLKFKPRVVVLIGRQSKEMFGIKDPITKASGVVYPKNNCLLIPLIHPSAVARSQTKYGPIFENSWKAIYDKIGSPVNESCKMQNQQVPQDQTKSSCSQYLNSENMITEITDDLMLFDIINLDNEKILKIFIDGNGKKKYYIDKYVVPIYIKQSTNWRDNEMITNAVHAFTMVEGRNRYYVNKLLKEQMEMIKSV
jgi:uracil-DNA glycosylase family 4